MDTDGLLTANNCTHFWWLGFHAVCRYCSSGKEWSDSGMSS